MEASQEPRWLTLVKLVGGGLMTLAAAVPAAFLLWPTMQPERPPDTLSAEVSELKFEPNVSLQRYLERENMPLDDYDPEHLATAGHVLRFSVTTQGFTKRSLPSQWSLYDSRTLEQVAELGTQAGPVFTPEAATDRASTDIWIPFPEQEGSYFVRLELRDDKGVLLDSEDSQPITTGRPVRLTRLPAVE